MGGSVEKPYVLIFDHGTTSVRACLMDVTGTIRYRSADSFDAAFPAHGWVEQDATLLWELTLRVANAALREAGVGWEAVAVAGLTNQRETTILWDVDTGEPVHPAIVWQCRRTADACQALLDMGHGDDIQARTGLILDAYFSASKIRWILDQVPAARVLQDDGRLRFGTVDTWILWKLTGGRTHATDMTNASRTMLYNIHERVWDPVLLDLFGVSAEMLPEVRSSNARFGEIDPAFTDGHVIPLAGVAGDQQSALHGQKCWTPGTAKCTYGTGAFVVMNTGEDSVTSAKGLLTTLATDAEGAPVYALEGAIFIAGAALEWLSKKLALFDNFQEMDALIDSVSNTGNTYLVPAFVGLGTPYWDANARGSLFGLTQDTGKAHLVRAAVEAMAYQTHAVLEAMQSEAGLALPALRVDGGVTRSRFLMQFLADILNVPVLRSDDAESTAKGAGYLAGLAVGFWPNPKAIAALPESIERFTPAMSAETRKVLLSGWHDAVRRTLSTN